MAMTTWLALILDGMTYGALLFLIASGLTLTFGLMRTLNLAHAGFYLLGGYLAIWTTQATGMYWLGLVVAMVVIAVLGIVAEITLIHRFIGLDFFKNELPQIIVTIGLAYIISDQVLAHFGPQPRVPDVPGLLAGQLTLGSFHYSLFRLSLMIVALATWVFLLVLVSRTKVGAMIRAAVDDPTVAAASGVKVKILFVATFGAGAALAAFAGVWGGAFVGLAPGTELDLLILALVVVVIGGLGSVNGALVGALLVGLVNEVGKTFFPDLTAFALFAPVALLLMIRPEGLKSL